VRRRAGCPRLSAVNLAGTAGEVALLEAAAERLCGLGSVAPIERSRSALQRSAAMVQFAEFELGVNESTTVFGSGRPVVLVNGKFQVGAVAERIAALLVHEGGHVADGGPPTAAAELAARKGELEACGRLFTGDVGPNRGCADAAALLADDDATVLDELRKAGYR
jgi:hypothetical protein